MGGLIGTATTEKDGLYSKSLCVYNVSKTSGLKEITGDADFLLILRHPYGLAHFLCSVNTTYGHPSCLIIKIGANEVANQYMPVYTNNKRIYIENIKPENIWIIPLNGIVTINDSSEDTSSMTKLL